MVNEGKNDIYIEILYKTAVSNASLIAETRLKYFDSYYAISQVNCWKLK